MGVIGSRMGVPILDPLVGGFVGLLILKTAFNVAKDNVNHIMGKVPSTKLVNDIKLAAVSVKGVYDAHDIKINYLGPYASAELHVKVESDLPLKEAHIISHNVEKMIIDKVNLVNSVTVHACPLDEDEDDENCYD